jgi:hypothetical protein
MKFLTRDWASNPLVGFISLLSSSAIGALGIALIASHRWPALGTEDSTTFLLALQWQALGVLLCKAGLDTEVFALVTKDSRARPSIRTALIWPLVPGALLYAACLSALFSPAISVALGLSIMLDVAAVIFTAELNARRRHLSAAFGTLLNYPLFFLLLWLTSEFFAMNETVAMSLFALSSLSRLLWLRMALFAVRTESSIEIKPSFAVAAQPLLNYYLFRSDQLFLTVAPLVAAHMVTAEFTAQYIFAAKFAEILGGILVLAGVVTFPRIPLTTVGELRHLLAAIRPYWWYAPIALICISVGAAVYRHLYVDTAIAFSFMLPFAIHAALVFPANLLTFFMYQHGKILPVILALFGGSMLGTLFLVLAIAAADRDALIWVVPIQLTIFLLLASLGLRFRNGVTRQPGRCVNT